MFEIPESLCSDLTDEQASTVQGGKKLRLKSMTALKADADTRPLFGKKNDDVYAVIDGEKVNIGSFETGDSKILNIVREVGREGIVRFYDDDRYGSDDPVGSMKVSRSIKDGVLEVFGSGSKYEIRYSLGFG